MIISYPGSWRIVWFTTDEITCFLSIGLLQKSFGY
jgi:hypothetical protein